MIDKDTQGKIRGMLLSRYDDPLVVKMINWLDWWKLEKIGVAEGWIEDPYKEQRERPLNKFEQAWLDRVNAKFKEINDGKT